jgi:thymidylate synthase
MGALIAGCDIETQLARESYNPPTLNINSDASIFDIDYEDLEIVDYEFVSQ